MIFSQTMISKEKELLWFDSFIACVVDTVKTVSAVSLTPVKNLLAVTFTHEKEEKIITMRKKKIEKGRKEIKKWLDAWREAHQFCH
jgi:hypothetical protein